MYIIYVYVRLVRVAESDTHVTEYHGTKQGRAQIPVLDLRECACPTTMRRIANDLGDDGDGGRSA